MRKILKSIVSSTTIAVSVLLVTSYLSQYISPKTISWAAFLGLLFPFLYVINGIFLLLTLLLKQRLFFVCLIAGIITYNNVPRFIQLSGNAVNKSEIPSGETYKLMSFNVRNFDLYNWNNNVNTKNQIIKFIKTEQPDIICFQEFFYTTNPDFKFNTLDTLLSLYPYHSLNITTKMRGNDFWGLAVFSKFPLIKKRILSFENAKNNGALITDVILNNDTLTLYNVHLASLHFGKNEYLFLNRLESDTSDVSLIKESTPLLKLMRNAFVERTDETHAIISSLKNTPYPTVLCGDFNDTPSSYCYQVFRNYFNDAFISAGKGLGRTYIGRFPSFRIDYILYQPPVSIIDFTTYNVKLSDHKPIAATFRINKN